MAVLKVEQWNKLFILQPMNFDSDYSGSNTEVEFGDIFSDEMCDTLNGVLFLIPLGRMIKYEICTDNGKSAEVIRLEYLRKNN